MIELLLENGKYLWEEKETLTHSHRIYRVCITLSVLFGNADNRNLCTGCFVRPYRIIHQTLCQDTPCKAVGYTH